jgi:hypothetical protein
MPPAGGDLAVLGFAQRGQGTIKSKAAHEAETGDWATVATTQKRRLLGGAA